MLVVILILCLGFFWLFCGVLERGRGGVLFGCFLVIFVFGFFLGFFGFFMGGEFEICFRVDLFL